jgi:hypothetical protein
VSWIEVHQALPTHAKTMEMATLLDVPEVNCVGHLVCLWLWAVDNAKDGWLNAARPVVIAKAARWPGEPGRFVDALLGAGLLDEDGVIHNWDRYAGRLMERRERVNEKTKVRMQEYRKRLEARRSLEPPPVTQSVTRNERNGYAAVTPRYAPTGPNRTGPTSSPTEKKVPAKHQAVIDAYLTALGRNPADAGKGYGKFLVTGAEMAKRGDAPADVAGCTKCLMAADWRRSGGTVPSLEHVRDWLKEWIKAGRPATPERTPQTRGTNGRAPVRGTKAVEAVFRGAREEAQGAAGDADPFAGYRGDAGVGHEETRPRLPG